jgi:Acetyltransferase (GNAT) family
MRLSIVPKSRLSHAQLRQATLRIFAPEHQCDVGPRYYWNRPDHDERHLALFDIESEEFVGTVHCVIHPPIAQDFTWWLDSRMRKKGYWRPLADDLAAYLKKKHRIEKVGFIIFGQAHLAASRKIALRLMEHFDKPVSMGGATEAAPGAL